MSEAKQTTEPTTEPTTESPRRRAPVIPPREPKGEANWSVTVRHSPLKLKRAVVKANGPKQAWERFLELVDAQTTPTAFKAEHREGRKAAAKAYQQAREFIAQARRDMPPAVQVIGAEYERARLQALRVKGTVSVEQIGFAELASV